MRERVLRLPISATRQSYIEVIRYDKRHDLHGLDLIDGAGAERSQDVDVERPPDLRGMLLGLPW